VGRDPPNPDQIDALASSFCQSEFYIRDTKTYLATLLIVKDYHKALKFSTVLSELPKERVKFADYPDFVHNERKKGGGNMTTVTSAELQKNFGRYGEIARREPVMVTNHGRESLVLLSADAYQRLTALDTRKVVLAGELSPEAVAALRVDDIDPKCAKYDHEMDG